MFLTFFFLLLSYCDLLCFLRFEIFLWLWMKKRMLLRIFRPVFLLHWVFALRWKCRLQQQAARAYDILQSLAYFPAACYTTGAVHKLRRQFFGLFWPPTLLRWHFLPYKRWQKVDILDYLPPSSFQRSLWTTPSVAPSKEYALPLIESGRKKITKFVLNFSSKLAWRPSLKPCILGFYVKPEIIVVDSQECIMV